MTDYRKLCDSGQSVQCCWSDAYRAHCHLLIKLAIYIVRYRLASTVAAVIGSQVLPIETNTHESI